MRKLLNLAQGCMSVLMERLRQLAIHFSPVCILVPHVPSSSLVCPLLVFVIFCHF